jgi:hypothetical protein
LSAWRGTSVGRQAKPTDLPTSISGVSFEEAWATRRDSKLDEIPVHFIGRAALLRDKEQAGRAKDLGDAEELREIGTARTADTRLSP